MAGREGVRSSARLSGAAAGRELRPPRAAAERAAAAAARRARAARAAERAREVEDSPRELRLKCRQLARALRDAKHLVVYTGAGISTAADIPDYRGPDGVWTRLKRGEDIGAVDVSRARPTFTHMALTALWARGLVKFVVSQNCDGLHLRAGLPRRALAELHGDMFAERCGACRALYLRAFDTSAHTARRAHGSRRLCHSCGGELRDSIVHFGERGRAAWPLNWAGALRHAARADVVLCLGSSLKVLRRYPGLWRSRSPPALYVVNLQWTPKDARARLKINARCDAVMAAVARRLRLRVPRYRRAADPLRAHAEPLAPPERHTAPPSPPPSPADLSDHTSYYSLSSPSATDSDDELPLHRLASRMRPAAPALRAFSVPLRSGDATILLRAEHAPADPPPPAPGALRHFRMPRRPAPPTKLNGLHGHDRTYATSCKMELSESHESDKGRPADIRVPDREAGVDPSHLVEVKRETSLVKVKYPERKCEVLSDANHSPEQSYTSLPSVKDEFFVKRDSPLKVRYPENQVMNGATRVTKEENGYYGSKLRRLLESKAEAAEEPEAAAAARAAEIMRRVTLAWGARLYPGLHTILGEAGEAECGWCARRGARRCLWYGPPRRTPLALRAWRRGQLCACCPRAAPAPPPPAPAPAAGWYGRGCRKGRRRPRR